MGNPETQDLVNAHLEMVQAGAPTTVEIVKKLADASKAEKIHVTLKRPIETPQRTESPARAHRFFSLEGYAAYLKKYGGTQMTVLADPNSGDMAAVLDEDTADGYEVVTFSPRVHPLYAPWQVAYGRATRIKDLAKFIIANRSVITAPAADRLAALFKQVQVSKSVKIMEGTGAEAVNGVLVATKIQGRESNQTVPLPEAIWLTCPMFVDSGAMDIQVDLLLEVNNTDESVYGTLVSADADDKRVLAVEKMLARLQKELEDKAIVSLGRLSYRDWNYLRSDDPNHVRNVPTGEFGPEVTIVNNMIAGGTISSRSEAERRYH